MTKPRPRRSNGPMVNQIEKQVSPDQSSSPLENNDIESDLSRDSPSGPVIKRKRGWAKPLNDWGTGKKLVVELNAFNQPIGETAANLESQLGVIARNAVLCPITFTSWKCKELHSHKERIWKDVKDNCEVLDTYRDNCLKSVGDKWRKWKWRIKQDYYSKFDNDEERLANVPPRVDAEQWKLFVQYQGTEMAMERSETNRENQNQRVIAYTSGRKSHQVVREELIKASKRGDRLDVYVTTHTNKKEKPVDQEAAKALDVIDKRLKEKSESEQTLEFREKIFIDVFGPDTHGRVRSFGKGPSPTQVFGKRNNQSPEQYAQDLERMREMGRKEGREEGFKEGLKEGRIEGREEGREEWRKDLDRVEINNTDKTIDKSPAENYMETSDAESSHQLSTDSSVSLYKVGTKVHLLSARLPKKVVAKGIIISIDPETKLNGFSIGDGYWVVRITEALLPHENLLIAQGNIRKVGHAVKHKVVWRKVDVKRN